MREQVRQRGRFRVRRQRAIERGVGAQGLTEKDEVIGARHLNGAKLLQVFGQELGIKEPEAAPPQPRRKVRGFGVVQPFLVARSNVPDDDLHIELD